MQTKYGVVANLGVADQHSTDGYHVWGQYWGIPFYPSKLHSGSPAQKMENKLDVVNLQWAPRDPLKGYGTNRASLYSTQDWFVINLPKEYFIELINLYGESHNNQFGQIVLGLEGDFPQETYRGIFATEMEIIKKLRDGGEFQVTNMKDFATWYKKSFPQLSPIHSIISDDSVWYQSPFYRIGFKYNKSKKLFSVVDLRVYTDGYREPYFQSPNKELDLYINLLSAFDSADNQLEKWELLAEEFKVEVKPENIIRVNLGADQYFELSSANINLSSQIKIPESVKNYPLLTYQKYNSQSLKPALTWPFPQEGLVFTALTLEAEYLLHTRKVQLLVGLVSILLVIILAKIRVSEVKISLKILMAAVILMVLLGPGIFWYSTNQISYFVSSDELAALLKLSSLPNGKVMVADRNCLQCISHSTERPAVFANRREYVSRVSKKPIVYNSAIFSAKDRSQARQEMKNLGVKYVYTVKYEDYKEVLPFSPGDLNVEKIFENANAQIWMVRI